MGTVIDIIFVCAFYLETEGECLDHFHPKGQRPEICASSAHNSAECSVQSFPPLISQHKKETPFKLYDVEDILAQPMIACILRDVCKERYDQLCHQ